ncbi:hypothetical protein GS3922_00055 [Geobacillus subterraneus]|uniref:Uncharacterized protein n=1 Tax=Geobacillus subterraneus TaxID=129338 RepID=A0ABM6A7Q8_9BACL|nr:hypothetical protein GS3922_00055 [Geobacillus subterraneus]
MGMDDISPTNSNKNKLFTFFLPAIEALLYEKPCSTFTLAMTKNKMNDKKMYILKGILKMIAPTPNPISFAKFPAILIFTIPPNKRFSSSNIFLSKLLPTYEEEKTEMAYTANKIIP